MWSGDSHCHKQERVCRFGVLCPKAGTLTFLPKGTALGPPEYRPHAVRLLHEGVLGLFCVWPTGKETLISLFVPGDICGLMWFIPEQEVERRPLHVAYHIRSLTPASLCQVDPEIFVSHVCRDPTRTLLVLKTGVQLYVEACHMSARPTRQGPEKALAHIIAVLAERVGSGMPSGTLIPSRFSHQDLADMARLTRSTATRALHYLCCKEFIKLQDKQIMVPDVSKLWELVEDERPSQPA